MREYTLTQNAIDFATQALIVGTDERKEVYQAFDFSLDFESIDSALNAVANSNVGCSLDEIIDSDYAPRLFFYHEIAEYYRKNHNAVDEAIKEFNCQSVDSAVNFALYANFNEKLSTIFEILENLED